MKTLTSELPALFNLTKHMEDLLYYFKSKALQTFFTIRKKPVAGSFVYLMVTMVVYSFSYLIGFLFVLMCHRAVCNQLSFNKMKEIFLLACKLWIITQLMPHNSI